MELAASRRGSGRVRARPLSRPQRPRPRAGMSAGVTRECGPPEGGHYVQDNGADCDIRAAYHLPPASYELGSRVPITERLLDALRRERDLPQPYAGGVEDRVADGR